MNFRLTAAALDFYVDVRLRDFNGQWLAVADIAGEYEMGLGSSAREALEACLSSLGRTAAEGLLIQMRAADRPRPAYIAHTDENSARHEEGHERSGE